LGLLSYSFCYTHSNPRTIEPFVLTGDLKSGNDIVGLTKDGFLFQIAKPFIALWSDSDFPPVFSLHSCPLTDDERYCRLENRLNVVRKRIIVDSPSLW
jgi:hypothetical protein